MFVLFRWPLSGGAAGWEAATAHPVRAEMSRAAAGMPRVGATGGPVAPEGPVEGTRGGGPPEPRPMTESLTGSLTGSRRVGAMPVFGLARPGENPNEVLFAAARKAQPGGPETVRAVGAARYVPVRLAPEAEIWVTAPLAEPEPADYVKGVRIAPESFARIYQDAQRRLGGVVDARAHMFELWLDERGRATVLRHYFSP